MSDNQRRHRRARRSVLLALALFCAVQAVFLATVEGWHPTLADAEFGTRLERFRALRRRHPDRRSIAVLGSSRVGNGFETDRATALACAEDGREPAIVVNMSMRGGTSVWQYLTLNRLIDMGMKPDAVVVEIFPMTLVSDEQYFKSGYHFATHRLRWRDVRSLFTIMPAEAWRHAREWIANNAVFPLHCHRFNLIGLFCPIWQVDHSGSGVQPRAWRSLVSATGWIPFGTDQPTVEQRRAAEGLARQSYVDFGEAEAISSRTAATYRALFACCREHGIEVAAVVMMPESDMFRELYGPALRARITEFTSSITEDTGIPVVDAREWIPAEDFWDGHHLLVRGAREFTDRVCVEALDFKPTTDRKRVAERPSQSLR